MTEIPNRARDLHRVFPCAHTPLAALPCALTAALTLRPGQKREKDQNDWRVSQFLGVISIVVNTYFSFFSYFSVDRAKRQRHDKRVKREARLV